ncbi:MAG TPA: ABC transporter ATP-binding protein [Anaerolineaceae bacterium]|nr:ABC transporter ATP-binding protein [Anaerolineaceae bacterium]
MLRVENLSVSLNKEPILKTVSFELHKGKILGLIGPNGAGKTTLIRVINGSLNMDQGKVIFRKHDLADLSVQERAKFIATVPQNRTIPAGFQVRQIVLMGRTPYLNWFGRCSKEDAKIAENAMRRTNTLHLADVMADELSGGEQQRVILARAFAQNTPLMLLDEPTTHLDIRFQMEFLDLLLEHVKEEKKSVIIAMHDLNQAMRFCDEVLLLSQGRIYADGKPQEVLTEKKLSSVYQYPIKITHGNGDTPRYIYPKL